MRRLRDGKRPPWHALRAGKFVDHAFFELAVPKLVPPSMSSSAESSSAESGVEASAPGVSSPARAAAGGAPLVGELQGLSLTQVLEQRESAVREAAETKAQLVQQAAAGGEARGGAVLGLMSQMLPPELRAKVLAFHPQAAEIPPSCSRTSRELFDHFITSRIGQLRALPFRPAAAGSTDKVALLVEPRCHPALEHCVRNAVHFLGSEWQIQILHGTENLEYITSLFSAEER